MNVHLHIERLVLDGVPIEARGGPLVQAAVEAELTRLLSAEVPSLLLAGGALPVLRAPSLPAAPAGPPARLGAQVARALYRSLGR